MIFFLVEMYCFGYSRLGIYNGIWASGVRSYIGGASWCGNHVSLLLGGALSLLVFFHMTCLLVEWGTEAIA